MVNCFRSNSYYNLKRTLSLILLFYHYPTAKVRKKNEFIIFSLLKRHMFANKEEPHPQPLSEWRGEWKPLFASKGKPLPQPLSEWRGEWKPLFANKGGVSLMQGEALLDIRKRPSRLEKGVSFNSRIQLPLFPLTILSHPTNSIHAPLHSERGRGEALFGLWGRLGGVT